jgi:hypothetical protein
VRRYYEFALVVILVSIMALVLLRALGGAQSDMEEAGVQAEAAAIRTQLLEAVAHRETFGGQLPASDNPMDWIAARPYNYIGERGSMPLESSVWYFDKNTKILAYRFRDGHLARFRLSREAGASSLRGVVAGIGLLRLDDKYE